MIIGKWNKSVILTYVGVVFSIIGMYVAITWEIKYALCCLMIAGVCDLFDGKVARSFKRTLEEEKFGVQLDSLADVVNFIVFPVILYIGMGFTSLGMLIVYGVFAICGIARLAYFNIVTEEVQGKIDYYQGLPVTYTALILPVVYLLSYVMAVSAFSAVYVIILLVIALLNIWNMKIKKPRGKAYIFFSILAIAMLLLYGVIL